MGRDGNELAKIFICVYSAHGYGSMAMIMQRRRFSWSDKVKLTYNETFAFYSSLVPSRGGIEIHFMLVEPKPSCNRIRRRIVCLIVPTTTM